MTGHLPSLDRAGSRVNLVRHQAEHDRHPVGDDERYARPSR